jgi:hypothetical protein
MLMTTMKEPDVIIHQLFLLFVSRLPIKAAQRATILFKPFLVDGNAAEHDAAIAAAEPWTAQNNLALSTIYTGLSSHPLRRIRNITYASEAWESLRTHYQRQNASIATLKASDLQAYRCTTSMDIIEWLNDMQQLYNELVDMDADVLSDHNFAITAINNLPQNNEWRSFAKNQRQAIFWYDHTKPDPIAVTSEEFLNAIREEHYFTIRDNPEVIANVFTARVNISKPTKRPCAFDSSSVSAPAPKHAHISSFDLSKTCSNSNCGRVGHDISDCITFSGGNQGNYGPWWRGPWNLHLPLSQHTVANNVPPHNHPAYPRIAAKANSSTSSQSKPTQANAMQAASTSTYHKPTSLFS